MGGERVVTEPPGDVEALRALARRRGIHTRYTDGLGQEVAVSPETLLAVCRALGDDIDDPADAPSLLAGPDDRHATPALPPVLVAWDGLLDFAPERVARIVLESGERVRWPMHARPAKPLPFGYHRLEVEAARGDPVHTREARIISAPSTAWRRPGVSRSWGLGAQLAALRSGRRRSVGDLNDLVRLGRFVGSRSGDLLTVLPLLPTFNSDPPEPSPYSPVSRLFWSELVLDLGDRHEPVPPPDTLDVRRADAEVRAALRGHPLDQSERPTELHAYAAFRGAQARLGRNWREWPEAIRGGVLPRHMVDEDEERFHLVAQTLAADQLRAAVGTLHDEASVRLGLDLAVGVHPDGYDTWSRPELFARGMSVGAPPDPGFPGGQNWGFPPILPSASQAEGHSYFADSVAHQAAVADVLRIDHIMALARLFWIPDGAPVSEGTYVDYPAEELFAVLSLESHRHRCEIIGENLGTVPQEISDALPRHGIAGMHLAIFEAADESPRPPYADEVGFSVTHDTPTLAGWVIGADIDERIRCGLLAKERAPEEHEERTRAVGHLGTAVGVESPDAITLLPALLRWLGRSPSPLVLTWIEDLWHEEHQVNLPGTSSAARPNWQRPMARLLDDIIASPEVDALLTVLADARRQSTEGAEGRGDPEEGEQED